MRKLTNLVLALWILLCTTFAPVPASEAAPHRLVIEIKGMMCSSCGKEVEKTLKKLPGIDTVEVDVVNDRATVTYDQRKVTPHQMAEAIRKAGYQAELPPEPKPAAPARH